MQVILVHLWLMKDLHRLPRLEQVVEDQEEELDLETVNQLKAYLYYDIFKISSQIIIILTIIRV